MKKWAYYNEFDPGAAAWLRELIKRGLVMDGEVDERSITEVQADDISGFLRVGFFAGIGGWDYALRLAGWPEDEPVWHGSCPCQAFSTAGKQLGFSDDRDLWPVFFRLIRECRPPVVFGEQVAAAIGHGWLDRLCNDLEGEDYAVGSAVLGAFSVGAPHKRERLYWGAKLDYSVCPRNRGVAETKPCGNGADDGVSRETGSSDRELADIRQSRSQRQSRTINDRDKSRRDDEVQDGPVAESGVACWTKCECCDDFICNLHGCHAHDCDCEHIEWWIERGLDPYETTVDGFWQYVEWCETNRRDYRSDNADFFMADDKCVRLQEHGNRTPERTPWSRATSILCRDFKYRRIPAQSGIQLLVDGIPLRVDSGGARSLDQFPLAEKAAFQKSRVGLLKGYGNAIVPQVAAVFIQAFEAPT